MSHNAAAGNADSAVNTVSSPGKVYDFKLSFGMVRIEWLRPDKSVESSDVYLGIEWEEDDLVENEEPVAWQRLAETFDDHSEVKVIINNNALHCNVLSTIPAEVVTLTNLKGGGKVKKAIGSGSCYS